MSSAFSVVRYYWMFSSYIGEGCSRNGGSIDRSVGSSMLENLISFMGYGLSGCSKLFQDTVPASLIKRRIAFNFSKVSLKLDVSESLFSSFDVDVGTRALLNSLRKNSAVDCSRVLDLGCGYGPMGLFLKAQDPSREVHMVDRDALAVGFALHNAKLNNLDVKVYPSLDYEQVEAPFSLIVTNLPAKLGRKGLEAFVYGASRHLVRGGVLCLVVVRELTRLLGHLLEDSAVKVLYEESRKGHTIFHLAFSSGVRVPEGKYERGAMRVSLSKEYNVRTAVGLPEFDSLSFGTRALFSLLRGLGGYGSVLVLEPGQGHVAVGVMNLLRPEELMLASRDLLCLRFAERNVRCNFGIEPETVLPPYVRDVPEQELVLWNIVRKDDFAGDTHNLGVLLKREEPFVVYGETRLLRRLLRKQPVDILREATERNYSARLLQTM
jgi:16S rRNA (guanine1207-N2)-methyltransferase